MFAKICDKSSELIKVQFMKEINILHTVIEEKKMIKKKILNIVGKYGKVIIEDYGENINLENDLGIDSIMLLQIIIDIEDEFNISISDEELDIEKIGTIEGLEKIVRDKIL